MKVALSGEEVSTRAHQKRPAGYCESCLFLPVSQPAETFGANSQHLPFSSSKVARKQTNKNSLHGANFFCLPPRGTVLASLPPLRAYGSTPYFYCLGFSPPLPPPAAPPPHRYMDTQLYSCFVVGTVRWAGAAYVRKPRPSGI